MPDETKLPVHGDVTPPSQDEVDQEFYTALRAAGASPEEARSCLQACPPAAG